MLFAPIRNAWVEGIQCIEQVKSDLDFIWGLASAATSNKENSPIRNCRCPNS